MVVVPASSSRLNIRHAHNDSQYLTRPPSVHCVFLIITASMECLQLVVDATEDFAITT